MILFASALFCSTIQLNPVGNEAAKVIVIAALGLQIIIFPLYVSALLASIVKLEVISLVTAAFAVNPPEVLTFVVLVLPSWMVLLAETVAPLPIAVAFDKPSEATSAP